jgi:hypothetical protein
MAKKLLRQEKVWKKMDWRREKLEARRNKRRRETEVMDIELQKEYIAMYKNLINEEM